MKHAKRGPRKKRARTTLSPDEAKAVDAAMPALGTIHDMYAQDRVKVEDLPF